MLDSVSKPWLFLLHILTTFSFFAAAQESNSQNTCKHQILLEVQKESGEQWIYSLQER